MKKVSTLYAAALIASLVVASFSFAQMETKMEPNGTKAEHMRGDMSSLMNDMSAMMTNAAGMIKDMAPGKMKKMSVLMKGLSKEMMNMSHMMGSGKVTDRELEKMHVRISKMQKMMSEMERKKE
jgi:hypothetical protein